MHTFFSLLFLVTSKSLVFYIRHVVLKMNSRIVGMSASESIFFAGPCSFCQWEIISGSTTNISPLLMRCFQRRAWLLLWDDPGQGILHLRSDCSGSFSGMNTAIKICSCTQFPPLGINAVRYVSAFTWWSMVWSIPRFSIDTASFDSAESPTFAAPALSALPRSVDLVSSSLHA